MRRLSSNAERIVIVGGGFAGLSAAARLAEEGLPVTVLEASKLGFAASTRNQGWLYSGAWFAPTHPKLANQCYESLQQTVAFCPECIEQGIGEMIYFSRQSDSFDTWARAWDEAGIPYRRMLEGELTWNLPGMNRNELAWAVRLPDRSFRPDVLLSRLASTARNAGAEIRPDTFAASLLIEDRQAYGVAVGANEEIRAGLVILAAGASSQHGFSQLYEPCAGRQSDYQLVRLKTHLKAIRPAIAAEPFCLVDEPGLNHLPHSGTSVFGTGRWEVIPGTASNEIDPAEIGIIEEQLRQLFPNGFREETKSKEWSGTSVQAMHQEQIEPGTAPLPTIIDHAMEPCGIENVLSLFPGRATLWADLAEQVRTAVLGKLGSRQSETSQPPWAVRA